MLPSPRVSVICFRKQHGALSTCAASKLGSPGMVSTRYHQRLAKGKVSTSEDDSKLPPIRKESPC